MKKIISILAICLLSLSGFAQLVANESELNAAINAAIPGTKIILEDGVWNDVFISVNKNGTAAEPITITAQNPGYVFMTGNSRCYMKGSYLTVSGLVFQNPSNLVVSGTNIEPIFELNGCDYCKVINNKIDSYNGTESQKTFKFKWVYLVDGQHNEIAYNSFVGKYGIGSIINDNRSLANADYIKIHHNYFADRTPINGLNDDNDQDAIRIGTSTTSLSNSFSEVYENYFYNYFGEIEVISNKSGGNKYYNNTFRDYGGCLTLRHGNNCEVFGNYFFAENNAFTGGVRVIGEGHKVYNNYIEGTNFRKPNGSSSTLTGGINVMNGEANSPLNGYYQVKNAQVINNTFVNCDYALRIGTDNGGDNTLAPNNLIVANNIMYNSSIDAYETVTNPTGSSISEGNLTNLAVSDLSDDGNFHRLTNGSSAIDAGLGNYAFLTQDILDGSRDANPDSGAEEFNANGIKLPYVNSDVGVKIGFGAIQTPTLVASPSILDFDVCGSSITFQINTNVSWTITENLAWLDLDITSGTGPTTITATNTKNETGVERSGTFSINEVAGGNNLTETVSVIQSNTIISSEIEIVRTSSLGMELKPEISELNAYDDNLTTYWTGDPDAEPEVSITFDLDSVHVLTEMGIHFWKADERTTSFSLAVSENEAGPYKTVVNNEASASSGVTVDTEQRFSLDDALGRYVKFIGIGNSSTSNWTSIANVNIYGYKNCLKADTTVTPPNPNPNPGAFPNLRIFPVPVTNGVLTIESPQALQSIEIYNSLGQRMMLLNGGGKYTEQINVRSLAAGSYILKLENIETLKFSIQ
jgi:poly(beta-D-mannuronate) lyase